MFDLELECTVGVGGGGRARICLPEEARRIGVEIASFSSDFNGARQIKFRETLK